jgi:threonine dehydrogenase-like Zn-dependent dehydrogenase
MNIAIRVARPGGTVGYVGVPHVNEPINLSHLFRGNIALRGGVAPVRIYMEEMMRDVIAGKLDPSPVLDLEIALDRLPEGYAAMANRKAIKAFVRV